jgi:hypothetical protein
MSEQFAGEVAAGVAYVGGLGDEGVRPGDE